MLPTLKAEARKLFTVRSTYFITAFCLLLVLFFAGYVEGFRASPEALHNKGLLMSEVTNALTTVTVFGALIGILLFSHEYRYNMIMYTLTSSNSRNKVLLAKIIVISLFAVLFTALIGVISPLATQLGIELAGKTLGPQSIAAADLLWHGLLYGWGYSMVGLLLVALTRNQVFAIVAIFFAPLLEVIGTALLKENAIYQPFTALSALLNSNPNITPEKAAVVFVVQLAVYWVGAWFLFLRRDAN